MRKLTKNCLKNILALTVLVLFPLQILSAQNKSDMQVLRGLEVGFFKTDIEYVACKLNEPFDPVQNKYTATVEKMYTAETFVTPYLKDSQAGSIIKINGVFAKDGERYIIRMKEGNNPVEISLVSKSGTVNVYTLNIIQEDWSTKYVSQLLFKGIWRIQDYRGFVGNEDMYLIEGKDKALLIDAGMGKGDLAGYVKTLTDLPVEVAVTHHGRDHWGQIDQFKNTTVYYPEGDYFLLPEEKKSSNIVLVKGGEKIDLGGRSFEVVLLPGHSPGHLVFYDAANNLAISADIFGSGTIVYMHGGQNRTSLAVYLEGLKKFENKIRDLDGLTLLTGHNYQEKVPLKGVTGKQLITDMRILVEKVIAGEIVGDLIFSSRTGETLAFRKASYGIAAMYYDLDLQ